MPNSDQLALAANLVNIQNAAIALSSAAGATVSLIDQHFAVGAVPLTRAAAVAAKAAADAQDAIISSLAGFENEAVALA